MAAYLVKTLIAPVVLIIIISGVGETQCRRFQYIERVKDNNSQSREKERYDMQKATFAAGCFWGVEQAFRQVQGVVSTRVGYTGGETANPSYEQVCSDMTGHAEAVEVTFDPEKVTYGKLLDVFWAIHNPTTLNRQGPDLGSQYRSAIFYHNAEQKQQAEKSKNRLEKSEKYSGSIVTQIEKVGEFWQAEDYHQQYYEKQGIKGCPVG